MQAKALLYTRDQRTTLLLLCGLIAGPFFTFLWFVQGITRPNYDPMRHAISSLSVGELGWIQIANFLITGALILAFSFGLRRTLRQTSGFVWGPLLIAFVGMGLIGSGIFVTDPLNGYPPGTPLLPTERTVHGILHDLFGVPVFLGLPIACFVFAGSLARRGERHWASYSRLSGIGMLAVFIVARLGFRLLPAYPELAANFGLLQRITVTIGFTWLTLLASDLIKAPSEIPATRRNSLKEKVS